MKPQKESGRKDRELPDKDMDMAVILRAAFKVDPKDVPKVPPVPKKKAKGRRR